ncbi:hypothetical protein FDP41_007506 [Naegleria fowleri]|uniref:Protein kinase domain-containing protein n=1 Tax=Naegleria fowleri TaxID=5763 RepID=A0A6A5CGA5_NAEFO|nr:uncharacterized protein FDP41_007506 [Naegleria fowleri]KAF0984329.1 hypothetical protein FDP41_007506 [Naegleria fowleri]CAG4714754.1 unnamed protein product [Naegleria fowleri]
MVEINSATHSSSPSSSLQAPCCTEPSKSFTATMMNKKKVSIAAAVPSSSSCGTTPTTKLQQQPSATFVGEYNMVVVTTSTSSSSKQVQHIPTTTMLNDPRTLTNVLLSENIATPPPPQAIAATTSAPPKKGLLKRISDHLSHSSSMIMDSMLHMRSHSLATSQQAEEDLGVFFPKYHPSPSHTQTMTKESKSADDHLSKKTTTPPLNENSHDHGESGNELTANVVESMSNNTSVERHFTANVVESLSVQKSVAVQHLSPAMASTTSGGKPATITLSLQSNATLSDRSHIESPCRTTQNKPTTSLYGVVVHPPKSHRSSTTHKVFSHEPKKGIHHSHLLKRRNTLVGAGPSTEPLFHYSRRLSVDHATMDNVWGRIMYNSEREMIFLNFENLKIESVKHLQNIATCISTLLGDREEKVEQHHHPLRVFSRKSKEVPHIEKRKVKCFLNDDDLDCPPNLLDMYTQIVHLNPRFESVTKYTNKSVLQDHQKTIQQSLVECEIYLKTHPCILDRFVVNPDEHIGKGTYGTVSVALDLSLGRKVAVKRLCRKTMKLIGIEDHVRNEMTILKLIKENPHPNIVQVLDVYEGEEEFLFVMEYLSGGCLDNPLVENEQHSERQVQIYFAQLVNALDHLHNKLGVIHRDIQPSNCCLEGSSSLSPVYDMLGGEKNLCVKLVDFGMSCFMEKNLTQKTQTLFCGNSHYASPEMILKKPYGPEMDVYALGVLVYKLLTGYVPFRGAQQKLLMQFTISLDDPDEGDENSSDYGMYDDEDERVKLSPACRDLLKKVLEVNAETRFGLEQVKQHEWYLQGNEIVKQMYAAMNQQQSHHEHEDNMVLEEHPTESSHSVDDVADVTPHVTTGLVEN